MMFNDFHVPFYIAQLELYTINWHTIRTSIQFSYVKSYQIISNHIKSYQIISSLVTGRQSQLITTTRFAQDQSFGRLACSWGRSHGCWGPNSSNGSTPFFGPQKKDIKTSNICRTCGNQLTFTKFGHHLIFLKFIQQHCFCMSMYLINGERCQDSLPGGDLYHHADGSGGRRIFQETNSVYNVWIIMYP